MIVEAWFLSELADVKYDNNNCTGINKTVFYTLDYTHA